MKRPRVIIFYKSVPQYRRRFYELLRTKLLENGITLEVVYGDAVSYEVDRRDRTDLPWGRKTRVRTVRVGDRELFWQAGLSRVRHGDLVIVEQASKLLANYVLFALARVGFIRLAMWGHGRTIRTRPASALGEALKSFLSRRVHWWFAYNERSARYVRATGFPDDRITRVQNAIDTRAIVRAARNVGPVELERVRRSLGLVGNNVCVFVGAMYQDKRLAFLVDACCRVRGSVPDFEMIFVGAGPDSHIAREAASRNEWMRYVGPRFGDDKIPLMLISKLSLMPGGVGLGVLDSFALGVPLVTTAVLSHGPEIEYLEHGVNGLIVEDDSNPSAFAATVASTLNDQALLSTLRAGCQRASELYTIESMVENFADGVCRALGPATPTGDRWRACHTGPSLLPGGTEDLPPKATRHDA